MKTCLFKKSLKMVHTAQNLPGSSTFHCLGPTWPGSPHFSAPESPFPEVKPALSPASSAEVFPLGLTCSVEDMPETREYSSLCHGLVCGGWDDSR